MSNEIILFGICLLFNKNENVQSSILKILKKDEKNVILTQLEGLIKQNSNSIAYYKPYEAIYTFPIPMNYSDTYDFYVSTEKIMERKFTYTPEPGPRPHCPSTDEIMRAAASAANAAPPSMNQVSALEHYGQTAQPVAASF